MTIFRTPEVAGAELSRSRLVGATALGIVLLCATPPIAFAQEAAAFSDQDAPPIEQQPATLDGDEITVTASRISRAGFEAPTPLTVVSRQELENKGATNVAAFLNDVPSFRASTAPTTTSLLSTANGSYNLDLRGIGVNRTLVLVNGRRHVPTATNGTVNVNVLPSLSIDRVDVVTGGASAAWGADAVAGVVNLVIDRRLNGVRAALQAGISEKGDGQDYLASVAGGGGFGGERGRFLIAAEYNKNKGIGSQASRDWGRRQGGILSNSANTGPNDGIPARLIATNVNNGNITEGGLIVSPTPLANIQFGPGGVLLPFTPGSPRTGTAAISGDGYWSGGELDLSVPFTRHSLLAQLDYELASELTLFFEGSLSRAHAVSETAQSWDFTPITIRSDNPFIPASLRALLNPAGGAAIGQFAITRFNTDLGFFTADSTAQTMRFALGARGQLTDSWSWEAYYQWGRTDFENRQLNNRIQANFFNAVDAVRSSTGEIVCRANLVTNSAPGCVPINLFGVGSPSPAAVAYVNGTEFLHQDLTQKVVAVSTQGEAFDLGAGPVSVALGAEYRVEAAKAEADELSRAGAFMIGNFLGITSPDDLEVKEVFGEVVVPLARQRPFLEHLELNAAVRFTDYSTSGTVTTWKVGGSYSPFPDLRFRSTYSRDIRAPNFNELYSPSSLSFASVLDPAVGTIVGPLRIQTRGNPLLDVERATTKTAGVVYEPSWLPGLRLSVDYYNIKILDAIGQITPQEIVNLCQAGDATLCAAVTRSGGAITEIARTQFNIGVVRTSGVDLEAQYRFGLDELLPSADGTIALRSFASYVGEKVSSPNAITFIDRAGEVGTNGPGGTPRWRVSSSVNYENGPLGLNANFRYVGGGKYDVTLREPEDINDNSISAQTYVDLSARYRLSGNDGPHVEVFAGVNNALDNDPPLSPDPFFITLGTNAAHYDVIGRFFYAGLRTSF